VSLSPSLSLGMRLRPSTPSSSPHPLTTPSTTTTTATTLCLSPMASPPPPWRASTAKLDGLPRTACLPSQSSGSAAYCGFRPVGVQDRPSGARLLMHHRMAVSHPMCPSPCRATSLPPSPLCCCSKPEFLAALQSHCTCTRPGPGFLAAKEQETLCSNLMPVIPAPAGHGHSSARAPVRPTRGPRYLRHAMPDCAPPATCLLPPLSQPTVHGCLYCTSTAPPCPPRLCSLDCNLATLRPALCRLMARIPAASRRLPLVPGRSSWPKPLMCSRRAPRSGRRDGAMQSSRRHRPPSPMHPRRGKLVSVWPFARQNPCSCIGRSLLFSTLRLQ
jgi:hypothetical protein